MRTNMDVLKKLTILGESARYDVSCVSSGSNRRNRKGGIGNAAPSGICHTFTEDGRCVSLLKILFSNACIYDCAYCVNRRGNDVPRAGFTVSELVDLTIGFYQRNYIEGLFLSSAVFGHPDTTMEALNRVARELRITHRFNGYIHMKCIPGANERLIREAGRYADRLSVNIELPSADSLGRLAADKSYPAIFGPMDTIRSGIDQYLDERRRFRHVPEFSPAGQSTQLIVGASPEADLDILGLSDRLYRHRRLRRVYYSAYVPVNLGDGRLPSIDRPPMVRENRLYQADWLMRFYGFHVSEIVDPDAPNLDLALDPKQVYALRHPEQFPVDVNRADYEMLLRVPGVGLLSARRIADCRASGRVRYEHLKQMGVVLKRATPYLRCPGHPAVARPEAVAGSTSMHSPIDGAKQIVMTYDGSFDGLLTAVFECYNQRISPVDIRRHAGQLGLFETLRTAGTDTEKARRVRRKLTACMPSASRRQLYPALLSRNVGVEMAIYRLIRHFVDKDAHRPVNDLLRIEKLAARVGLEAHRMKGLVRFEEIETGVFAAVIEPDFDVLPMIRQHFEARFGGRKWIIHDARRHYGLFHDGKTTAVIRGDDLAGKAAPSGDRPSAHAALWRAYFRAMSIPERRNLKQHLRKLPRRYWKNLPEKHSPTPSVP